MGKIEDLKAFYCELDWRQGGEHWAEDWGGSKNQWIGTILPRIISFLPANKIVELGPGHGRISVFLNDYCKKLDLVDLCPNCIEICKAKFAGNNKIQYICNNGQNLGDIAAGTVDFVFSIFSLVHSDSKNLYNYLADIEDKLDRNGVAFIHHSNAREYLDSELYLELDEYRDTSVSAEVFNDLTIEAGLVCIKQEIFGWDQDQVLTDCFSVVTKPGSRWATRRRVFRNHFFSLEAQLMKQHSRLYGSA